jgi:DNA repair protein RecO (recombination protein O)
VQVKTKAIVLLNFKKKSLIVKCFTLSHGLKSYFVQDAFQEGNRIKKAYLLTILEIEAVHKTKALKISKK